MPTLGPIIGHGQQEESRFIGKMHLFSNYIAISGLYVLFTISSLDVTYCKFVNTYKTNKKIKNNNSYQDGNSFIVVVQSFDPSVGIVQVSLK
jgi:hypothetical protein